MQISTKIFYIFSVLIIVQFMSCTTNPFSDDNEIEQNLSTIKGNVKLSDSIVPDSIYIWLENFNIGTFTNSNGEFALTLPSPQAQPGGGVTGVFNLYCYVVNYKIHSIDVAVQNGTFMFGEAGVGPNGWLRTNIILSKLLNVSTSITPNFITSDFRDSIKITLTVNSIENSVEILAFKNQDNVISGAFILHTTLKNRQLDRYILTNSHLQSEFISTIPRSYISVHKYNICELPKGIYEVIPFIWVKQKNIPPELIENFTPYPVYMSEDYLKLPFKRNNGTVEIEYCDHVIEDPP